MADPRNRLQVVEEIDELPPQARPAPPAEKTDPLVSAGATALMLGLKALSQRAIAEARTYFTLLSVASAWWLWWSVPDPSNTQIVSLSIYAVFVLAANVIVRRF